MKQTVLITGGSGLVGNTLKKALLLKGYRIIVLTRNISEKRPEENVSYALWDIKEKKIDLKAVEEADYIVHLAGAGVVAKKWTTVYKKEIIESRTESSRLICDTLKNNTNKVKAVLSASAIGFYGPDTDSGNAFTETDKADDSFLGRTCKLWEESINPVTKLGKRLVKLRTGIVLSNNAGALVEFKKPLRFAVAAILGNGKQVISWIHIDDLCRLFIAAIENDNIEGTYNAAAPLPVSNKKLTITLARAMNGKFYIPLYVPAFVLKLIMGERSIEVLKSTTVSCQKILNAGFTFTFDTIESALADLTKK
ncbi:MAG: TIGR01777 family oxidoreductase [Ferruginibacter sp.]